MDFITNHHSYTLSQYYYFPWGADTPSHSGRPSTSPRCLELDAWFRAPSHQTLASPAMGHWDMCPTSNKIFQKIGASKLYNSRLYLVHYPTEALWACGTLRKHHNRFCRELCPLGELTMLPRPSSRLGREYPHSPPLDAFGISDSSYSTPHFMPPRTKSWCQTYQVQTHAVCFRLFGLVVRMSSAVSGSAAIRKGPTTDVRGCG